MPTSEIVKPDEIIGPDGRRADWDDPCPVCGSVWSAGPERIRWGRQHCWRCGYAPGQTTLSTMPGAPAQQPDWAQLVRDAVAEAMRSEPQAMAEAMTAALGREGLADLARQQQDALGMTQTGATPPPAHGASGADS